MPVSSSTEGGICRFELAGHYTLADLIEKCEAALRSPDFIPGTNMLMDMRSSEESPSHDEILRLTGAMGQWRSVAGPRCAIVVGDQLHYGIGRMIASYAGQRGPEVMVFRSLAEALAWLTGDMAT